MTTKHRLTFPNSLVLLFCFWQLSSFGQDTSLTSVNKKIISRYFDEVVNTQSLNRMNEYFSQDYIWHQMGGTDSHSNLDSSHIAMLRFIFTAIPDIHYTINNIVAERDMIAVNSTVTGTAKSEMFGLPAAQKKVSFKQMFFFRLVNNKIKEEWEVVDVDGMKTQLAK
jgi:steroid delta-isomerase-like uncharacterized protein